MYFVYFEVFIMGKLTNFQQNSLDGEVLDFLKRHVIGIFNDVITPVAFI